MKKLVFFLFMTLAFFAEAERLSAQENRDWANLKRYAEANAQLGKERNSGKRVVFMGNSITEGWMNTHPDFFRNNGYIGRGISGQTSYQFLVRFREDVIKLSPAVVVINAGTNDVAENTGVYNEDYTFGNIVSMVELAQANRIKVILTSILPTAAFGWNESIVGVAGKIAALNTRLKEYAVKNMIIYVDYYAEMVYGEEKALNPAYTKDGVHPTAEGYDVMELLIKTAIDNIFEKQ